MCAHPHKEVREGKRRERRNRKRERSNDGATARTGAPLAGTLGVAQRTSNFVRHVVGLDALPFLECLHVLLRAHVFTRCEQFAWYAWRPLPQPAEQRATPHRPIRQTARHLHPESQRWQPPRARTMSLKVIAPSCSILKCRTSNRFLRVDTRCVHRSTQRVGEGGGKTGNTRSMACSERALATRREPIHEYE